MLDMARAREVFEASQDFTVGHRGGVRDPRSRRRGRSRRGSRSCATPPRPTTCSRESVAGELISLGDRDPLAGRRRLRDGARRPAREPRPPVPPGRRPRTSCSAPPAPTRGAPGRSSRSSTPSTTSGSARTSATSPTATTRSRCTCTWACAAPTGRSRSATGCATILPELLAVSANSPFLDGRDSGLHSARTQIFTKSFPRCGIPDAFGRWAGLRRLRRLPRGARTAIVEHTQLWWSVRPHHAYGTVEVRICDAQSTRRGVDRAGRARRCVRRAGRARLRRRAAPPEPPPGAADRGELLAGDPLRAQTAG